MGSFVLAGLPAGPLLAPQETCSICLEPFRTGEHVQLMPGCRHVYHAGCIKMLLRSRFTGCLAGDCGVPCPLCRGPLTASSILQIPPRERPAAVTLNAAWLTSEANSTD